MARRVGIHAAATATTPSTAIVAVCDRGSHGSIPKSRPRIDRAAVSAPAKPRLIPIPTTHETWRTIRPSTWLGVPPIARRTGHFVSAKSNEIGEQAVQTDCREGDGGHAEGAEQPRVETAGGGLVVDQFVQRRYPCERLILIQLANDRTKCRRDRSRFSSGANEDGHRPRVLRVRLI